MTDSQDTSRYVERLKALTGREEIWAEFTPKSWEVPDNQPAVPWIEASTNVDGELGTDSDDTTAGALLEENQADSISISRARSPDYRLNPALRAAAEDLDADSAEMAKLVAIQANLSAVPLHQGEPSARDIFFTPWRLVQEYPNMYMGKQSRQRSEQIYAKLLDNKWDFYYLYDPRLGNPKPILFVPTAQLDWLLDYINAKLGTALIIPEGENSQKFYLTFGIGGTPTPRYLGRSTSKEGYEQLRDNVPMMSDEDDLQGATPSGREDFLETLDVARSAAHSKKKKSEKNRIKRIVNHRAWGESTKRVQRYLGLREQARIAHTAEDSSAMTTELPVVDTTEKVLDVLAPAAHPQERGVFFLAVDVEAYEFNHELITEVGFAMLNTKDIAGVPPGEGGSNWFAKIQARHIRVKENTWAVNQKWLQGCPGNFCFGTSEFRPKRDLEDIINNLVDPELSTAEPGDSTPPKQPVVLVFHDSRQDIKYMHMLGYDVPSASNVIDIVDTKNMHGFSKRREGQSLETVLAGLDIPYSFLHNAGNDAVYTLQAMIGMAIEQRQKSLERAATAGPKSKTTPYSKVDDDEGWSTGGEDSDGGEPMGPVVDVSLLEHDARFPNASNATPVENVRW